MHHGNHPGPGAYAFFEIRKIDLPTVVVEELVGRQTDIVELRQEVDERIARLGNQHLISRIAQQPEEEAVGLAGAGGQEKMLGIEEAPCSR